MSVDPSAEIEPGVDVGAGTSIWQLAHVRAGVTIGRDCVIGRGVYVGPGVQIGDRVKIQNSALVYEPARLAEGVFVGPAVVLTNDKTPRAVLPTGARKSAADWTPVGVTVERGASLGARAVCVAPVRVGQWAMVAAGAVVTNDVPDYALVVGVPARQIGWVGPAGERLVSAGDRRWRCPVTSQDFRETDGILEEMDSS